MATKQITVKYCAEFTTTITVNSNEDGELPTIMDMISDVDIPENEENKYVSGSMEVLKVTDHDGDEIPEADWDK
jgi:hypothetical protein